MNTLNMSGASQDRHSRWQAIQEGLQFIESTLPYRGSPEEYEVFIKDLVWNLFGEGNDMFRDGEWTKSIDMYTEALSIADYAESDGICTTPGLLEKLYSNRAAAYLNVGPGFHEQALKDCENALQLNSKNYKVLYRKAKSLKEMGRHSEAYEAVAKCSLAVPQDLSVIQLTQDLAKIMGLKIRKAYVRSKPALNILQRSSYQDRSSKKDYHGPSSVEDIDIEVPQESSVLVGVPSLIQGPVAVQPPLNDTAVDDLLPRNSISSATPNEPPGCESVSLPVSGTTSVPLSAPVCLNGITTTSSKLRPLLETSQNIDTDIMGDELDELLDQPGPEVPMVIPAVTGPIPPPTSTAGSSMSNPFAIQAYNNPFVRSSAQQWTVNLPPLYQSGSSAYFGIDTLDTLTPTLDSLESLSIMDYKKDVQGPFSPQLNNHDSPMGMAVGMPNVKDAPAAVDFAKNPLAETHEFKQACSICFLKTGPGVLDYRLKSEDHKCKKDVLLGRIKHSPDKTWKLIRPRPTKNHYVGPYHICKDVAVGKDCQYQSRCTFAYCQEEIDVWTLEQKGFISRELLLNPLEHSSSVKLTVPKILQEHPGIFTFLCGVCFDHKPRFISKINKDDPLLCSHAVTKHDFEENKCLVHILNDNIVRYSKIRPLSPVCQLDLCRHEVRYGCTREGDCLFAHSLIELKVWMIQHQTNITHETIVQEAKKFFSSTTSLQGAQRLRPSNLKLIFGCGQCWRNGQISEADKNKKYCSAKARHTWAKDRWVVLVFSHKRKKWTTVRPLPARKPAPFQFEICSNVAAGKKCQYIGVCTFAHSEEERDFWTFMKKNNIPDMDQLHEQWPQSQKPGWGEETAKNSVRKNERQIHMPTDDAEEVAGNHCWLCGKNCNSERQWQKHITSEKHKDRVFNSEDDQNGWQYRFPTGTFKVCERFLEGICTEDDSCKLAHGKEELKEWMERRDFFLMKLAKARKDHLIAPNDSEFGKYSFLLKDIE